MNDLRIAVGTAAVFGIAALLLAVPSVLPAAVAEDEPMHTLLSSPAEIFPQALDPDALLKWDFEVEPWVSGEPVRQSTVRKIGYGRTSFVTVIETATGVYSSDGLDDPHVRYPGIHRSPRPSPFAGLAIWDQRHGWTLAAPLTAGSFVTVVPFEDGQLITTDDGSCVVTAASVRC